MIQDAAVPAVFLSVEFKVHDGTITNKSVKVLSNMAVDITKWVDISAMKKQKNSALMNMYFILYSARF